MDLLYLNQNQESMTPAELKNWHEEDAKPETEKDASGFPPFDDFEEGNDEWDDPLEPDEWEDDEEEDDDNDDDDEDWDDVDNENWDEDEDWDEDWEDDEWDIDEDEWN